MKKILFTSLAVLGLGITGCSNEDLGALLLTLTLTIHYPVEPGPRTQGSQEYWKVRVL